MINLFTDIFRIDGLFVTGLCTVSDFSVHGLVQYLKSSEAAAWAAAIGTLLLFAATTYQITRTSLQTKEAAVRYQAERVSAWVAEETGSGKYAWIVMSNSSHEPVYRVIVSIVSMRGGGDGAKSTTNVFRAFVGTLPPGRFFTYTSGGYRGMSFQPAVELLFVDKSGQTWVRKGDGRLTKVAQQPHEYYGLHEPLPWQIARQSLKEFSEYTSSTGKSPA